MIRVATWNLEGLDDHHLDVRTEAMVTELMLGQGAPEVILLQELVHRTWHAHARPHLAAAGYALFPTAPPRQTYFCAIAARPPVEVVDFRRDPFPRSAMGRALLSLTARVDDREWLFATSHLESMTSGAPERISQLGASLRMILDHPGPAIFGGDLNLRDDEPGRVPEAARARDVWEAAGRPAAGRWTWDAARIPGSRGRKRRRYDRLYVNPRARVEGLAVFGAGRLPGGAWPSDHLGLTASLADQ